jgi:hypothetical protein
MQLVQSLRQILHISVIKKAITSPLHSIQIQREPPFSLFDSNKPTNEQTTWVLFAS